MRPIIVMDTREHKGKKDHIIQYFDEHGIRFIRTKLYVGDWTLLHDQSVCVDTKAGLQEVYSNLIYNHERFRDECIRARDAGISLIVLVEEPDMLTVDDVQDWVNPRAEEYAKRVSGRLEPWRKAAQRPAASGPPVSSKRLMGIMRTMSENYGVAWDFCDREHTGERICGILGLLPTSSGSE